MKSVVVGLLMIGVLAASVIANANTDGALAGTYEDAMHRAENDLAPFHTVIHIATCAGHQTTELVLTNGRWKIEDVIELLEKRHRM